MRINTLTSIAFLSSALLVTACAQKSAPSLEGRWLIDNEDATEQVVFRGDGTYDWDGQQGDYTLDGNYLTIVAGTEQDRDERRMTFYANDELFAPDALRPEGDVDGLVGTWFGETIYTSIEQGGAEVESYAFPFRIEFGANGTATYVRGVGGDESETIYAMDDNGLVTFDGWLDPLTLYDGVALAVAEDLFLRIQ